MQSLQKKSNVVLLDLPAVQQMTGLSSSTIYRMIVRGDFPQPLKISRGKSRWVEAKIAAYIDAKIAEREAV